nr:MAG TPA: hypothetical protein [Herelleviridae sp.]DAT92679.1 MAG TPA: hypothetical protein [Herelleviridae sp.]
MLWKKRRKIFNIDLLFECFCSIIILQVVLTMKQ